MRDVQGKTYRSIRRGKGTSGTGDKVQEKGGTESKRGVVQRKEWAKIKWERKKKLSEGGNAVINGLTGE